MRFAGGGQWKLLSLDVQNNTFFFTDRHSLLSQFLCYFHGKFNQSSDGAVTLDININVSILKIVCSSCKLRDMIDNNANFSK